MSTKHKASAKDVIAFYWRCIAKYPYHIIGLGFVIPASVLFGQFLPPLILASALHRFTTHDYIAHQPWQSFSHEIILYTAVILFSSLVLWRVYDAIGWKLEERVERDISRKIFQHLSNESADFHANNFTGSLVSATNKALGSFIRLSDTTYYNTFPLLLSLIFTAIILHKRAPLFVVCLIAFALFYIFIAIFVSKGVRTASSRHANAESRQTGYLADAITNIMAIKSFSGEKYENKNFGDITANTELELRRLSYASQKQMAIFSSTTGLISAASFVMAIVGVVSFNADVATVFLILNYTTSIVGQLFSFSNNALKNYNRAVGDATEMVSILSREPDVLDPVKPETPHMFRGAITFDKVGFTHKDAETSIFTNLKLKIKPGEKVGLIGHSGSGKTSLTRILLRFSDIDSGSILIDGQNIASVTQSDLRAAISYVPQEPLLFHRTIKENIGYGRPEASQQEIEIVARQAHADDFIKSLPKGYDTLVGERGVKLSGGQRQRVAIARAMIKNAPILVLDEATSALDSESEQLIQDALWKLMDGRTAIVIAHRLSTIQKMDRIIVLEGGKIVEQGSHKDLIRNSGVYADLWNRQSGGFIEE